MPMPDHPRRVLGRRPRRRGADASVRRLTRRESQAPVINPIAITTTLPGRTTAARVDEEDPALTGAGSACGVVRWSSGREDAPVTR
ncbi:MAG: hypothetical protein M3325_04805, partial [Actinomycetota bacterium]|nr:hypothetical protein [Actinomycetota bacterium]